MKTLALSRLITLVIAGLGAFIGIVGFLVKPELLKRSLERASLSSFAKVPTHVKWVILSTATAVVTLFATGITTSVHSAPASSAGGYAAKSPAIEGGSASTDSEKDLPTTFEAIYTHFPKPNPRVWIQVSDGSWLETYDGKKSNVFSNEGTAQYNGCAGTLLSKRGEESFEAFLPDIGCSNTLMFRWSHGSWQELGKITKYSQTLPSGDTSW